jgi:hypothetical protein
MLKIIKYFYYFSDFYHKLNNYITLNINEICIKIVLSLIADAIVIHRIRFISSLLFINFA